MPQNTPMLGHATARKPAPMLAWRAIGLRLRRGPTAVGNAAGGAYANTSTGDPLGDFISQNQGAWDARLTEADRESNRFAMGSALDGGSTHVADAGGPWGADYDDLPKGASRNDRFLQGVNGGAGSTDRKYGPNGNWTDAEYWARRDAILNTMANGGGGVIYGDDPDKAYFTSTQTNAGTGHVPGAGEISASAMYAAGYGDVRTYVEAPAPLPITESIGPSAPIDIGQAVADSISTISPVVVASAGGGFMGPPVPTPEQQQVQWQSAADASVAAGTYGRFAEMGHAIMQGDLRQLWFQATYNPQSPAAQAGLSRGDQILTVNGRAASELVAANDFSALSPLAQGEQVTLQVRDSAGTTARVVLTAAIYPLTPAVDTGVSG